MPLEECFLCVFRKIFSVQSPCSSFSIALLGEKGEVDYRGRGEGGLGFRFLVPEGGRCNDKDNGRDDPTAAAPHPNCVPAYGGPEISGTTVWGVIVSGGW